MKTTCFFTSTALQILHKLTIVKTLGTGMH